MKVLLVEDDRKLARLLHRVFTEEGFIVDTCTGGGEGLEMASTGVYDILLLDWMLPDQDGLSVCRELRRTGSRVPILMLTARGQLKERVLGLQTGADDYVVKPFEVEELVARVHALIRRGGTGVTVTCGALSLDPMRQRALLDGQVLDLTQREFGFLLHLARRTEQVVTKSELLTQVWGITFDPGSNIVEVQVSRLRDKLGEHAWMVDTVRGKGYRLRATQDE